MAAGRLKRFSRMGLVSLMVLTASCARSPAPSFDLTLSPAALELAQGATGTLAQSRGGG